MSTGTSTSLDLSPRTFYVAGVQFRPKTDIEMVRNGLITCGLGNAPVDSVAAIPVELIGEPSNQYDRYAVKCKIGGTLIGYIPKPINIDVWAIRDAGHKPTARLVGFNPTLPPYQLFQVQVTFAPLV